MYIGIFINKFLTFPLLFVYFDFNARKRYPFLLTLTARISGFPQTSREKSDFAIEVHSFTCIGQEVRKFADQKMTWGSQNFWTLITTATLFVNAGSSRVTTFCSDK